MSDIFGDRMKKYEKRETDYSFLPYVPVIARLDGRAFSTFTKDCEKPFDKTFSDIMGETTKHLVEKSNAKIGYTQSDEISLVWMTTKPEEELIFGGKAQKLCSVLSGMATSMFMRQLMDSKYKSKIDNCPHFDCRVFQVPNEVEAANAILWRERDAVKNATSSAAQAIFSHKTLQGKNDDEMRNMLNLEGIDFDAYPLSFRHGSFYQKRSVEKKISDDEYYQIPKQYRGSKMRTSNEILLIPIESFNEVSNRTDVIFRGEDAIYR